MPWIVIADRHMESPDNDSDATVEYLKESSPVYTFMPKDGKTAWSGTTNLSPMDQHQIYSACNWSAAKCQ